MKMFSECSGECCVCSSGGFCLAGHGDDDFRPASKEKVIENLDEGEYPDYTEHMIRFLAVQHNYVYDIRRRGSKKVEIQKHEQPTEESFGGYTYSVVVKGNCVSCGKEIDGNNIFLCCECKERNEAWNRRTNNDT